MKLSAVPVIPTPHHSLPLFFFSLFLPSHLSHTFPWSRTWAPPSSSTGAGAPFLLISQTVYGFTEYGHIVCEVDLFLFAGRRGIGDYMFVQVTQFYIWYVHPLVATSNHSITYPRVYPY